MLRRFVRMLNPASHNQELELEESPETTHSQTKPSEAENAADEDTLTLLETLNSLHLPSLNSVLPAHANFLPEFLGFNRQEIRALADEVNQTTPTPSPQPSPQTHVSSPTGPIRAKVPENFWTDIRHYPGTISSADYYDEGPTGQKLREDIEHHARLREKWEAKRKAYIQGSKH